MRSASAGHRRPRERQCCRQRGRFFCLAFRASAKRTPMNDVLRQAGRIQGFPAAPELVLPPQTLVISLRRAALQGAPQLSFLYTQDSAGPCPANACSDLFGRDGMLERRQRGDDAIAHMVGRP